jgi:hypothetical protein
LDVGNDQDILKYRNTETKVVDLATLDVLPKMAESVGFDVDIISYPDIAAIGDAKILHGKLMSLDYTHCFRMGGVKLTFDGSP